MDEREAARARRRQRARRRAIVTNAAAWATFLVLTNLGLRKILTTSVVADDLYVMPYQYRLGGSSFVTSLKIGLDGASLGHFNYLGQIIGGIVGWIWIQLSLHLGIRFSLVFATTKYLMYLATILAAARFVGNAATVFGWTVSRWRARALVAVALVATLQIHIPWSNDPTAGYPMSGFASAALGFAVLAYALTVYREPTLRRTVLLSAAAVVAVLYYELNVAVVAALTPLALAAAWSRVRAGDGVDDTTVGAADRLRAAAPLAVRAAAPLAIPVAVAAIATGIARVLTTPPPGVYQYGGTSAGATGRIVPTFFNAVVSTFPGAAWSRSRTWLDFPVWIGPASIVVLALLGAAVFALAVWFPAKPVGPAVPFVRALPILAVPVVYWFGATAIQAATAKVQTDSLGIGYVYNYYAIAVTGFTVLVALAALAWLPRLGPSARAAVVPSIAVIVAVQFIVNWNVASRFNETTVPMQQILVAHSDDVPEAQRCAALRAWASGGWPDYYRNGIVGGLAESYQAYRGRPYCSSYPLPPPVHHR